MKTAIRLSFLVLLALGTALGCSGGVDSSDSAVSDDDDDDGSSAFTLSDGSYTFTADEVIEDTCWAEPKTNPELPMAVKGDFTNEQDGSITVVTEASGSVPSQTLKLEKSGNDIAGGGEGDADLNSQGINCILHIVGSFDGIMTGDDAFDATQTVTISEAGGDSCWLLVGTAIADQLDNLPCTLTVGGSAIKNP